MKPSADLFDLIQAMTPSEKGYFKKFVFSGDSSDSNNYLLLFEAIEAQQEYDEAAIKKKFKGMPFIKQLSNTKAYLHKIILRALRNYSEANSPITTVNNLLNEYQVLFDKGLMKQARKKLDKAAGLAEQIENPYLIANLYSLQRSMMDMGKRSYESHDDVKESVRNERAVLERALKELSYEELEREAVFLVNKYGRPHSDEIRQQYDDLLNSPLLEAPLKDLSRQARIYYYATKRNTCHVLDAESDEAINHAIHVIEEYEGNEVYKEARLLSYINQISSAGSVTNMGAKPQQLMPLTQRLKDLETKSEYLNYRAFTVVSIQMMSMAINSGDFLKGYQIVPDVLENMAKYQRLLSYSERMVLQSFIFALSFCSGEWEKAIECYMVIENEERYKAHLNHRAMLKLAYLACLYETGDRQLLFYRAESTRKWCASKGLLDEGAKLMLSFYYKLSKSAGKLEDKDIFQQQLDDVEAFMETKEGFQYFESHFMLVSWVKSKLSGKSMSELTKESLKEFKQGKNASAA